MFANLSTNIFHYISIFETEIDVELTFPSGVKKSSKLGSLTKEPVAGHLDPNTLKMNPLRSQLAHNNE